MKEKMIDFGSWDIEEQPHSIVTVEITRDYFYDTRLSIEDAVRYVCDTMGIDSGDCYGYEVVCDRYMAPKLLIRYKSSKSD